MGYEGYQINTKYLLGNTSTTVTPKGLFVTGSVGRHLSLYIANYKGGRNECFVYGVNEDIK